MFAVKLILGLIKIFRLGVSPAKKNKLNIVLRKTILLFLTLFPMTYLIIQKGRI